MALPNVRERGIVQVIKAIAAYADLHKVNHSDAIGNDGVLGDYWKDIVMSTIKLLNADCGRLDCGVLDSLLCEMLANEGYDSEGNWLR